MAVDQRLLAVPREVAARLAGLSPARADYWARTEVAPPTTDETLANGRRVRLYEFIDLLALLVAAELRGRGVSLQHIRALVAHLRDLGFDNPLTELRFATAGRQVYIQYPDGTWSGGVRPEQLVFHQVLNLELIRRRILEGVQRDEDHYGAVARRRGVHANKPVIAGTRVPVATVQRYLQAGRTDEDILAAFPELTPRDLEAVRRETVA